MTADDQTQDGGAATPLLVTTRPRVSRATSQEFGQADFQGWTRGGVTGMGESQHPASGGAEPSGGALASAANGVNTVGLPNVWSVFG